MHSIPLILTALGPIIALTLLGWGLRWLRFPGDGFWPAAERFTYFILFPSLLVHQLALARLGDYAVGAVAVVIVLLLLTMTLVVYLLRPAFTVDGPAFSSVYQGVIRFNTYVGLAIVLAVFHADGVTVAALVMAIMIPLINVLCILVLNAHVGNGATLAGIVRSLISNPLILGCLLGISLNVTGIGLPYGSGAVLDILGRAALPLGLLAVGAGFRVDALARPGLLLGTGALKLLGAPVVAGLWCWLVQPGKLETAVVVTFAALPTASAAYVLARQLGGDAPLMAAIFTVETALALVTLPLVLMAVL